jgi:hypothetical protein
LFDSIFNYFIILIPVAIFIGRIVVQARSKLENEHKRSPPVIPVHFEDEEDDAFEEPVKSVPMAYTGDARKIVQSFEVSSKPAAVHRDINLSNRKDSYPASKTSSSVKENVPAPPECKNFAVNLSRLSPMKQAVVMAEVLGPPKALL